jgi:hypothetical protein
MSDKIKKQKVVFLAVILILSCLFFLAEGIAANAGSGHNVSGWAWSSNIGWISFNSDNCDPDNNGFSNGASGCPAAGTAITNYGGNFDPNTGEMSGFAWSNNIGWIKLNPTSEFPGNPAYGAKLDKISGIISGWIRACAGMSGGTCLGAARDDGWDGWIKMTTSGLHSVSVGVNSLSVSGLAVNFIDLCSFGLRPAFRWNFSGSSQCDFSGSAWGDDVVGWISFSSKNFPGASTPYGVFSRMGGAQVAYQVQVAYDVGFTSIVADSGKQESSSNLWAPAAPLPSYNTTYYWRLKAWSACGATDWVNGGTISAPAHAYPVPNFNWSPKPIISAEPANFIDLSVCVGGCTGWAWAFPGSASPPASNAQNPVITFSAKTSGNATLTATDSLGYACSTSKNIIVIDPLPKWKEITPF